MSEYRIPDGRQAQLCETLTSWLANEEFTELAVARKTGAAESLQGSMDADELGHVGDASAVLDEVVERWGSQGGTFVLRGIFGRDPENGNKPKDLKTRKVQLVRSRSEQRTKSRGSDSGMESLSSSLAGALDTLQRQVMSQGEQQANLVSSVLERSDDANFSRLQEATQYQAEISNLRIELAEERLQRAMAEQQGAGMSPDVLLTGLQLLAPPVAEVLQALAHKMSSSVLAPAVEAPEAVIE